MTLTMMAPVVVNIHGISCRPGNFVTMRIEYHRLEAVRAGIQISNLESCGGARWGDGSAVDK